MLVKEAKELIRPAAGNTKMNCGCWGLPVSTCTMRGPKDPDSTCNPKNCYAQRNQYRFPNVLEAQNLRLANTNDDDFVLALTTILNRHKYFRFFDAGDFPSSHVMRRIMRACELAPFTKIHIPSKKYDLIKWYRKLWPLPDNVVIRAGMHIIDVDTNEAELFTADFPNIAIVSRKAYTHPYIINGIEAHVCPAVHDNPDGQKRCIIDCDWCWHPENEAVIFPWH